MILIYIFIGLLILYLTRNAIFLFVDIEWDWILTPMVKMLLITLGMMIGMVAVIKIIAFFITLIF